MINVASSTERKGGTLPSCHITTIGGQREIIMPKKMEDLVGRRFGRLVVTKYHSKNKDNCSKWICICDCGKETIVFAGSLRSGHTLSCGCLREERRREALTTHGMSRTLGHVSWLAMRQRCIGKTTHHEYKKRGITICERWSSFEMFYMDMGEPPANGYTLDRINNDLGYFKENCRWATKKEQARNRRTNLVIPYLGRTYTLSELAEVSGIERSVLVNRIKRDGWTVEDAVNRPVIRKARGK